MPYVYHEEHREYVHEEYPKMLTKKDAGGRDVPVLYPDLHAKQGLPVIFENASEEKAHFGSTKVKKG